MAASRSLREAIHHTLQQTDNDLEAQNTATDYAARKRMHEFNRAIDELKWQKQQVGQFCLTVHMETVLYKIIRDHSLFITENGWYLLFQWIVREGGYLIISAIFLGGLIFLYLNLPLLYGIHRFII